MTDVSATQLVYNRPAAVQQMFSEVHFDNRQLLLMRPSRYKTKTMRLQLGDESYSAPSVHQTQQVRIVKGCCHHYKLETKHASCRLRDAPLYQSCSFFNIVQKACEPPFEQC